MSATKRKVRKRATRRHMIGAREYDELMRKLGLSEEECCELFGFRPRTSRRYRSGDGQMPVPTLVLIRLMARGVLTKEQLLVLGQDGRKVLANV
jgi:hypothetical protein